MNLLEQIKEAGSFIKQRTNHQPKIGLVLGSGLGTLADEIELADKIPFSEFHISQNQL